MCVNAFLVVKIFLIYRSIVSRSDKLNFPHTRADTREAIMQAARPMVQARGYNALSFRDLAAAVGVKSASVHYHFPTKGDLAAALARRYTDDLVIHLDRLHAAEPDAAGRLRGYTDVFRQTLTKDNRMCLCGVLSAEHDDLPPEVRAEVARFTQANIDWLAAVLSPETPASSATQARALAIFAAVEGAQLVARSRVDVAAFDAMMDVYRQAGLLP
jgi:TetR/AcrR family transcriptional repressor of nem operon